MSVNETVLEMHYHKPLMDLFRTTFGVGPTGQINFFKYSPQREVFIGFDQAYVRTELTEDAFLRLLRTSADTHSYRMPDRFVGYFLQFKVVTVLKNRMAHTPIGITAKPHYRATLCTAKDDGVAFSQHQLLHRLSRNLGAMVYYACPMLFDRADLYNIDVDLDTLRIPDLATCPSEYADNGKHHIYFDSPDASPVWCSEPQEGRALSAPEFARVVLEQANATDAAASAKTLLDQLTHDGALGLEPTVSLLEPDVRRSSVLRFCGEALTVIQIPGQERPA
ncbi:MAG: hypothetical protein IPN83_01950 [Holophagales bacterium]|nr:hypothetical protein [Holophagales bacterium]